MKPNPEQFQITWAGLTKAVETTKQQPAALEIEMTGAGKCQESTMNKSAALSSFIVCKKIVLYILHNVFFFWPTIQDKTRHWQFHKMHINLKTHKEYIAKQPIIQQVCSWVAPSPCDWQQQEGRSVLKRWDDGNVTVTGQVGGVLFVLIRQISEHCYVLTVPEDYDKLFYHLSRFHLLPHLKTQQAAHDGQVHKNSTYF